MIAQIEALLKQKMGLDGASIGSSAVARSVQRRVAVCGRKSEKDYWKVLRSSETELQELIEAVVVPETWFFRDPATYETLANVVAPPWLDQNSRGVFRVLSIPCSTGEEPYSMAMALLDAGVLADRFKIDAVDISNRALATARDGVYRKNSFRGKDLAYRDRHFTPTHSGWKLNDSVRGQVEFCSGNVLESGFTPDGRLYDAVFCRNLLIYFDRPTQERAIASIQETMDPNGWFFIGPSETGLMLSSKFTYARVPLAFAFRLLDTVPVQAQPRWEAPPRIRHPRPAAPVAVKPTVKPFSSYTSKMPTTVPAPVKVKPKREMEDGIERALQLADRGLLSEAMVICEEQVAATGPTAQACYVMGLVRDAEGGQTDAVSFYRKAIYLDPRHQAAMRQLGSLLDSMGNKSEARVINGRAERLAEKLSR